MYVGSQLHLHSLYIDWLFGPTYIHSLTELLVIVIAVSVSKEPDQVCISNLNSILFGCNTETFIK